MKKVTVCSCDGQLFVTKSVKMTVFLLESTLSQQDRILIVDSVLEEVIDILMTSS